MKIGKLLVRPIITEKSTRETEGHRFTFEVDLKSAKKAIAQEVASTYKVDVLDITTTIVPGKQKRIMGKSKYAKLPRWKKAVVTLKAGQKIDLFEVKES